jgi:ribosomal protein S18 acetylase RimI-like enzyme
LHRAAFCICSLESPEIGWTDPVGVRPPYQRLGLGRAILTAGLLALNARGALEARLGTSSENIQMQWLAEVVGFKGVSEKL